jgi:hypothetical protein
MVFVLGSQFLIASHQLPVKADNANAASTVPPAPPQLGASQ